MTTTLRIVRTPATPLQRARVATAAVFVLNSVGVGAWIPRIPEVKAHLHLSPGSLGLALLAPAIGSLIGIPVVGRCCARFGSARTTRVVAVAFCLLGWLPALAPDLATLATLLLLWGMTMGGIDVAMNAQAVTVERGYGRPVLSSFHAAWSLGALTGAGLGSAAAAIGVAVPVQQLLLLGVGGGIALWLSRAFLADPTRAGSGPGSTPDAPGTSRWAVVDTRLVLLGAASVCALLAEGSVGNWSAVLLRDSVHVGPGQAGLAYVAFQATMTTARMLGDRTVARLGRTRTLQVLGGIGVVGSAAGLAGGSLISVVVGFGLLGVGLASMVPVLFSSAAGGNAAAGPALAVVTSMGYTGFLIGPALIGGLAQRTSVLTALWLVPVLTAVAVVIGSRVVGRSASTLSAAPPVTAGTSGPDRLRSR